MMRVTRPAEGRLIAGVCAGLARSLGWPVTRFRIGYVLLSVLSAGFPGALVYGLLWLLMPNEQAERRTFHVEQPRE